MHLQEPGRNLFPLPGTGEKPLPPPRVRGKEYRTRKGKKVKRVVRFVADAGYAEGLGHQVVDLLLDYDKGKVSEEELVNALSEKGKEVLLREWEAAKQFKGVQELINRS